MKNKNQFRQGDVLVERVHKIQTGKPVPPENGRVILAHGEATGHAHAIAERDAALHESSPGVTALEIRSAMAALRHDEHSEIPLAQGTYAVIRQREYAPGAIRNVAD